MNRLEARCWAARSGGAPAKGWHFGAGQTLIRIAPSLAAARL